MQAQLPTQPDLRRPLGVLFDFGDTLVQDEVFSPLNGYARLMEFASDRHGLTAEEILRCSDKINDELNPIRAESLLEFTLQSFFKLVFGRLGLSFSIDYAHMEEEFWDAAVIHRPAEGIFGVLDTLDANSIQAGVLSNIAFSGEVLVHALAGLGFAARFSVIVASSDYAVRKPRPHIFTVAAKKLGLAPADIWFVGDRLDNDVAGAISVGMTPFWYNRRGRPIDMNLPCLEVRSWIEFRNRLQSLLQ